MIVFYVKGVPLHFLHSFNTSKYAAVLGMMTYKSYNGACLVAERPTSATCAYRGGHRAQVTTTWSRSTPTFAAVTVPSVSAPSG
jgi:hypothetical protein